MSELTEIRDALTRLSVRLEKEENYQHEVHRRHPDCRCVNCCPATYDTNLHRLQQNLAEIRQALNMVGTTQENTMTELKYVIEVSEIRQKRICDMKQLLKKVSLV